MEVLQDIEEALNFPAFFDMPVGATLNDVMVVALSDAKHVWGWRSRARDILRGLYQRYRRPPFSGCPELGAYAGRMLFTWLYPRPDMKAFVLPLLEKYDSHDYVVLGPSQEMQQDLPGKPAFVSWDAFPQIDMAAWRKEFARCAPLWRARLNAVFKKHSVPAYVGPFLLSHLQTQTQFVMAAERFLDLIAPSVIVTEYDRNAHASCLLLAANKRGIRSVTMVHASAMPYPSYGMTPLVSTYVCCWGEVHRDKFRWYGVSDDRLVVTGCQATLIDLEPDGEATRRKVGLAPNQQAVLLATSPIRLEDRKTYASVFCEAMTGMPGVSALVRLHPAEHLAEYQEVIDKYPDVKFFSNSDMGRDESLALADLIVSHESSFGMDALIKGKPVIVLDLPALSGSVKIVRELIDYAGCPSASDARALRGAAERVLSDAAWRSTLGATATQYASRHCVSYGPDAAAKVCKVIDRLVAGSRQPDLLTEAQP
jgi:hypothetical protein